MLIRRVRSGRSSVGGNSVIYEPETVRMQRDIEKITQKLEHEKRESNYLDERIEMMSHEIALVKQKEKLGNISKSLKIPSKTPNKLEDIYEITQKTFKKTAGFNHLKGFLQILEKKLEVEIIQLNEAKAYNKTLRSTIDDMRLERLSYKRSLHCLQDDLNSFSQQAESKNSEYRRGEDLDHNQKRKISMLRCKSASEKSKYGEKISQLTSVLQEEKQLRSKVFKEMEQEVLLNLNRPIEGIEVSKILKKILEKWSTVTKDKKKQLDSYTKHIKVVEDAFKQIQQATGISSIEEIVTAFIKSQEQNYEVYTYMNNLNSEIDVLEENLRSTKNRILIIEQSKESGKQKGLEMMMKIEKDCEIIQNKIANKKNKLGRLRNEIQSIVQTIGKVLNIFESLNLNPQLNQKLDRDWLENFNEENIMNVLGYIEEFINYIVILLAYSNKTENPVLKHLPLEALTNKNFDTKNFDLKDILEAKDLYDDKDIEEAKVPLQLDDLKAKASEIFEYRKAITEGSPEKSNP